MQAVRPTRPLGLYALTGLLVFTALGALYGGYGLVRDPTGGGLGMSAEWLARTGFPDYLVPGLILFAALGLLPLVAALLLWRRPEWGVMQGLERRLGVHWVWGLALGVGAAQMVWIGYQVATMGLIFFLQPLMFAVGLLIVGLCLLPSVRRYYARG